MTVREEAVRLSLEDAGFSTGIAKDAAAVALLKRELDGLPGSANKSSQSSRTASKDFDNLGRSAENSSKSIDKFSGRLGLLISTATALGPALVPLGAVGIPAIAGLTAEVGFLAIGVGTTVFAFEGLGKALTAFNKASLEPTATNIAAAQVAMDKLSPSAQRFVLSLHQLGPEVTKLQQAAGEGLFPGLDSGLHSLLDDSPLVQSALRGIGSELGALASRAGGALSDHEWQSFLKHVGQEAPSELEKLGQATGDVTHGLMELFLAFDPLNRNFSAGIVGLAEDFDRWATSLDKTKGFQDFIVYVQTNGPRVIELLGDTASLFVDIVKAAAPLGGPTIQALDLIVKALDAIANSPLGTPLLALAQINAILKLTTRSLAAVGVESKLAFGSGSSLSLGSGLTRFKGGLVDTTKALTGYYTATERASMKSGELEEKQAAARRQFATGAIAVGAFALASSGVASNVGLANTATLAMAGSLAGPWGAAAGAAVGVGLDLKAAADADAEALAGVKKQVDALASSNNVLGLGKLAQGLAPIHDFASAKGGIFSGIAARTAIPVQGFSAASTALNQFNRGLTGSSDPVTKLTQLQAIATRMQPAMSKLGLTLDDLVNLPPDQLGKVIDHLTAITLRSDAAVGSSKAVTQAFVAMGDQSLTTADRVTMLTTSLDNLIDPVLNLGAAHDAFTKGLNDISTSLSKNSKTLVGNSDAAIQNRDAIRGQVTNLKTWIEAQAKSGASSKQMTASLKAGRQAIIEQGEAAGLNRQQIQHMIDTMHLTPKLIKTLFKAETAEALTGIAAVDRAIAGIDKVVNVHVNVTRNTNALLADVNTPTPKRRAAGGPIVGPGGPRDDLIPALLSNGEYVINAASVAKYGRAMFDRLNRFANGGPVDPHLKHPLFTHEGPHWYKAAYKHNRPFAKDGPAHWDWPYQTGLDNEKQVREFNHWLNSKDVPFDPSARITDYDMRGFWKKTKGKGWHHGSHFPDTFKTPYDTTFSHESKYATTNNPFYWHGNKLIDQRNGQVIFAANGGPIAGPGGPRDDMVPAWLSNGEYVVNAKSASRFHGLLDMLNSPTGFASGGQVGSSSAAPTIGAVDPALRSHSHALADDTKALQLHQSQLKSLISAERQYAQSVTASLQSDLFAQPNTWGQNASPQATLRMDIANARAFNHRVHSLMGKGLSGGALTAVETAQDPLAAARMLDGESRKQIRQIEHLFRERQQVTSGVGRSLASNRFEERITEVRDEVRKERAVSVRIEREMKALRKEAGPNADRAGHAMNDGAHKQIRTGVRRATK